MAKQNKGYDKSFQNEKLLKWIYLKDYLQKEWSFRRQLD